MDVIHQRVAGLDVHKETIVACVRIMVDARVSRECRTFDTTTAGLNPTASLVLLNGLQRGPAATGAPWQDQHQRAREADAQCCDGIRHVAL